LQTYVEILFKKRQKHFQKILAMLSMLMVMHTLDKTQEEHWICGGPR
jgi:hypothetical protein